ncbi:hypothetical protein Tco_0308757 [Tanacetum coccineum]
MILVSDNTSTSPVIAPFKRSHFYSLHLLVTPPQSKRKLQTITHLSMNHSIIAFQLSVTKLGVRVTTADLIEKILCVCLAISLESRIKNLKESFDSGDERHGLGMLQTRVIRPQEKSMILMMDEDDDDDEGHSCGSKPRVGQQRKEDYSAASGSANPTLRKMMTKITDTREYGVNFFDALILIPESEHSGTSSDDISKQMKEWNQYLEPKQRLFPRCRTTTWFSDSRKAELRHATLNQNGHSPNVSGTRNINWAKPYAHNFLKFRGKQLQKEEVCIGSFIKGFSTEYRKEKLCKVI